MPSRHVFLFLVCASLLGGSQACGSEADVGIEGSSSSGLESGTGPAAAERPLPTLDSPHFRRVDQRARRLAAAPHSEHEVYLPRALRDIGYDEYRSIRYRPESALWRGESPFEIQLFHPGYQYGDPVAIHLIEGDRVRDLEFDPRRFRYEGDAAHLAEIEASGTNHAGFRVHYPLNDAASKDEVAVFLGASYFRLLGPGHVHGLSSRGIAVDTGLPSGEEFPDFREFWLVRPGARDRTLTFYALLDGPSLTGAYRFELRPGTPSAGRGDPEPSEDGSATEGDPRSEDEPSVESPPLPDGDLPTVLDVEARLYARDDVEKLGVAPLTSMFLFDPNNARRFDDYRARVHDSHGLLALNGSGEWIWRPLHNGPGLRVTQLRDADPRGFGLVQRERGFESYLDLEARYDRRPSEWVEVLDGDWGSGGVELVEIPSESEFNDNIVAYWAPDAPFRAGEARWYRYRLVTFDDRLPGQDVARVARTRIGWDALPGQADPPPRSRRRFVVDFVGRKAGPSELSRDSVQVSLATSAGTVEESRVEALPDDEGWRVSFELRPDGDRPSDMRLHLDAGTRRLTETWSYVWYPEQGR